MNAESKLILALRELAPAGQHMSANTLTWREKAVCKVLDDIIAKQNKLAAESTLSDAE